MTTPHTNTTTAPTGRHFQSGPANDAILRTASGEHRLDVKLADSFLDRFVGLMFAAPLRVAQGLLLTCCPSVHGAFLRAPIDVIYLDREGVVTKCVAPLRPWRASVGGAGRDAQGRRHRRAVHTLELAAGAVAAFGIRAGDRLEHAYFAQHKHAAARIAKPIQRGSAMVEFTVVGPIITLLGLGILQYGMLFFAKNQINHAGFMAAREGSTAHANIDNIYGAYVRALVPIYGGGQNAAELAASLGKATADVGPNTSGNINIELLNPTKESFEDWNDPALQAALHTGAKRVIPNAGQAFKTQAIGAASGQTIQDANLLKLRITQGYLPKVPLIKDIYPIYLKWLDPHTDAFHTKLVQEGRIPVVSNITVHMQSDAIEPGAPVSSPGGGNGGSPVNPGDPPIAHDPPPDCGNIGCTSSPPTPAPPPACNPVTDPAHCESGCGITMCCAPK